MSSAYLFLIGSLSSLLLIRLNLCRKPRNWKLETLEYRPSAVHWEEKAFRIHEVRGERTSTSMRTLLMDGEHKTDCKLQGRHHRESNIIMARENTR